MLFHKCPTCGEFAFIQPDLSTEDCRVFRCENGHVFRIRLHPAEDEPAGDLPEWMRILRAIAEGEL